MLRLRYLEKYCLKIISSPLHTFQIFLFVALCLNPQVLKVSTFWSNSQKNSPPELIFFCLLLNIYSGSKLEYLRHYVKKWYQFFLDILYSVLGTTWKALNSDPYFTFLHFALNGPYFTETVVFIETLIQ